MGSKTPLLDTVGQPSDTRRFSIPELRRLADELRSETIDAVSVTGGHLGAGLGVVELTVALHHAQTRAQMSASDRHGVDGFGSQFVGKLP